MEEELISKKDLLELKGISYGQLYRWKRKNLIPDEWFIRKSTYTGQETFFPKEKILLRVDRIKNMKDDTSLNDLADVFSPDMKGVTAEETSLVSAGVVTRAAMDFYRENGAGASGALDFAGILYAYLLDKAFKTHDVSLDECRIMLKTLEQNYPKFGGKGCTLIFIRKMGSASCILAATPAEIYFDENVKIVISIDLGACAEELKIKLLRSFSWKPEGT